MATLSYTTHFTVDIPDDDTHTITGGSTTATDSISITHYFDRRYSITNGTLKHERAMKVLDNIETMSNKGNLDLDIATLLKTIIAD